MIRADCCRSFALGCLVQVAFQPVDRAPVPSVRVLDQRAELLKVRRSVPRLYARP